MKWRNYNLATRKFFNDNGFLQASALTFYTLFAVVPILAASFGIAKGFGLETFLNKQLEEAFPSQEVVVQALSEYAQNLLAQSSGGVIAGVALLILFYSVYSMLNHIEQALNDIWQVPKKRSISSRMSHYLALILIAPIILVVTGSLKIFIAKRLLDYNPVLSSGGSVISLLILILLFTWVYQFMPNIKVKTKTALFGGVHAGIAFTLVQTLLIESQLIMSNYGAIYGSLAALPIFLLWVQISWVILLFGAELCFVWQNNVQPDWVPDLRAVDLGVRHQLLLKIEAIDQTTKEMLEIIK
jgi:membrane protein